MGASLRRATASMRDLGRYTWRTGAWWFPAVLLVLALGAVVATAVQVVVPTVVYVMF